MDLAHDNFRADLRCSSVDGHLSSKQIAERVKGHITDKDIYLCGPVNMTEGFARLLKKMAESSSQIHYEEFSFR